MIADRFDEMYLQPLGHLRRTGRDVRVLKVLRASQQRAAKWIQSVGGRRRATLTTHARKRDIEDVDFAALGSTGIEAEYFFNQLKSGVRGN